MTKKDEFEASYKMLSAKMTQPIPVETCYKMLLQQMVLVNDVHSGLTFNTKYLSQETIDTENGIEPLKH